MILQQKKLLKRLLWLLIIIITSFLLYIVDRIVPNQATTTNLNGETYAPSL